MRLCLLIILLFLPEYLFSQTVSSQLPGALVVDLDVSQGIVKDDIPVPYGTRLLYKFTVPDSFANAPLNKLYFFFKDGPCPPTPGQDITGFSSVNGSVTGWLRPDPTIFKPSGVAQIIAEPDPAQFMLANHFYCLLIRRFSDGTKLDSFQQTVSLRTESKFADYIKLDFGLGYSFRPGLMFGSLAAHFYTVPVHDEMDIAERFPLGRQLLMRTSLFAGIAPVTFFNNKAYEIKPSTSVGNVIFGIGFRGPFYYPKRTKLPAQRINGKLAFQSMRLNVGWLLFSQPSANTLVNANQAKIAPFISITYDLHLTSLLGPIAKLLGAQ